MNRHTISVRCFVRFAQVVSASPKLCALRASGVLLCKRLCASGEGAAYGNRTRLLGLGSRCTTDVLMPQKLFRLQRYKKNRIPAREMRFFWLFLFPTNYLGVPLISLILRIFLNKNYSKLIRKLSGLCSIPKL